MKPVDQLHLEDRVRTEISWLIRTFYRVWLRAAISKVPSKFSTLDTIGPAALTEAAREIVAEAGLEAGFIQPEEAARLYGFTKTVKQRRVL